MKALLVAGICLAAGGSVAPVPAPVERREPAAVLAEMRRALGGDAALDAVKALSMTGSGEMLAKGYSMSVEDDYFLVLPDKYVRVRRMMARVFQSSATGYQTPRVYEGFRGEDIIRTFAFRTPAVAIPPSADRLALARWRHHATRLLLVLTGRPLPGYPLTYERVRVEEAGGTAYDVIEAQAPGEVRLELYVDAHTRLPAMIATTGLERSGPSRWLISDFKKNGALMWPRHFEEQVDGGFSETVQVRRWRVNPRIDARTFTPK
jgi:hypothetical protein